MTLSLIVALDRRGVIGVRNRLPWRLPDDLRNFKALTLGHAVVMGRKTYESIGRPLPGRRTIVVTRQEDYRVPGATVVHSLEAALAAAGDDPEVFVAGGGSLYVQALPLADRLYVTEVETEVVGGDTTFPAIDRARWRLAAREGHPADARHPFVFSYATYVRAGGLEGEGGVEGTSRPLSGSG